MQDRRQLGCGARAALVALTIAVSLAGCGGGSSGDDAALPAPEEPQPQQPLGNPETSYANFKSIGLTPRALPPGDNTIRAYADFAGTGRLGLFRAQLTYTLALPPDRATPSRFEFFVEQADGSFAAAPDLLAGGVACVHPRKAVVADFNGDRHPDVFVACHGYDALPFPGETNRVVLSRPDGRYDIEDVPAHSGFNHGAAAADVDGDGDVDLFVVDNFDTARAYVLLNNGQGRFARDTRSRLPTYMRGRAYFSIELVDVDEDGRADLVLGGHEFDGATTAVFRNPGNFVFAGAAPTRLPAVAGEGVVLDFTVTGSGANRALWIVRTSGGDGTFYESRSVQKVAFPSLASTVVLNERPARWIPWLVPIGARGEGGVASDNLADGVTLPP